MSKSRKHDDCLSALTYISIFLVWSSIIIPLVSSLPSQSSSPSPSPSSSSLQLSSSSYIHRRDPLRHFKYYNGVYDVRNKHYWASTAFTGVHGYAAAGAWMVSGLVFGIYLITKNITRRRNDGSSPISTGDHSDVSYYVLFFLAILFSFIVMAATGFVVVENQHSLHVTRKLNETVFKAGNEARRSIHKVNKVMNQIQALLCPYDQGTCKLLNATSYQLGKQSHSIQQFMQKKGHTINRAIWSSYILNLVVVTLNLFFVVAGLVLMLLHWYRGFIILIFLCWILTAACWFVTGMDFFVHNFAEDTCTALKEFKENPLGSSLNLLLPCGEALKSQSVMVKFGKTVHNFVTQLNLNMRLIPKELGLDEASYHNVLGNRKICDPFAGPPDYVYLEGKCPTNAISIHELPQILERFTCNYDKSLESCKGYGKFLPQTTFLMADAYIRSIQELINIYPDLEDLIHCSIVEGRVSDVVSYQCKPFKVSTYLLWVSMLSLSSSMVILVLVLVAKAYQDRRVSYSRCSIIPRHDEQL